MHRFNPQTEPATVQIEANPRRYATIAMIDDKGKVRKRVDGKDDVFMIRIEGSSAGSESRMWVPPRIANDLTSSSAAEAGRGIPPVARVIGSRTAEEASSIAKTEAPVRKKE
jgi:hypothetical protein